MAGIYDTDILRDILGVDGIWDRTVNGIIALVEKREMARDDHPSANTSVISSFKEEARKPLNPTQQLSTTDKICHLPCPQCGQNFTPFSQGFFGWNSCPYEICVGCFHTNCQRLHEGYQGSPMPAVSGVNNLSAISQISLISAASLGKSSTRCHRHCCRDSCTQSSLWSLKDCLQACFKREDLIPVSFDLSAANTPMEV